MIALMFTACIVLSVSDGDSMHVKCPARKLEFIVRVLGEDAPELKHPGIAKWPDQPYSHEAAGDLKSLCLNQKATLVLAKTADKYGRTDASVSCNGEDVATYQISHGNAWAYLTPKGSKLPALQAKAQAAKLGLWELPNPIAPSDWRKGVGWQ